MVCTLSLHPIVTVQDKDMFLYQRTLALPKAEKAQRKSFARWMRKTKPLVSLESHFLDDDDDVVALRKETDDSVTLSEPLDDLISKIFDCFSIVSCSAIDP